MSRLVPAPGHVAIVDPPQQEKKLWTPPAQGEAVAGVVQSVADDLAFWISPGDLVYYHRGHATPLGDVWVVSEGCIIATERD